MSDESIIHEIKTRLDEIDVKNQKRLDSIELLLYGPDGQPQKGLIMRMYHTEKFIETTAKWQTRVGWLILSTFIAGFVTVLISKVQII